MGGTLPAGEGMCKGRGLGKNKGGLNRRECDRGQIHVKLSTSLSYLVKAFLKHLCNLTLHPAWVLQGFSIKTRETRVSRQDAGPGTGARQELQVPLLHRVSYWSKWGSWPQILGWEWCVPPKSSTGRGTAAREQARSVTVTGVAVTGILQGPERIKQTYKYTAAPK